MLFLLPLLLGTAPLAEDQLNCTSSFFEAGRLGIATLLVNKDYTPQSMRLAIREIPGRFEATIVLDPVKRGLPGTLQSAFFGIRFTGKPIAPMTMRGYADGKLRWQRRIDVVWSPPELGNGAPKAFAGHADNVAQADDGLPVPAPRELRFTLTDAKGREVGSERYALPGTEPDAATVKVLAAVDAAFQAHRCILPPPLID